MASRQGAGILFLAHQQSKTGNCFVALMMGFKNIVSTFKKLLYLFSSIYS